MPPGTSPDRLTFRTRGPAATIVVYCRIGSTVDMFQSRGSSALITSPMSSVPSSAASIFAESGGDLRRAEAYGAEAVAVACADDDDRAAAEALNQLGGVRMRQGRDVEASELTRRAVATARQADDPILLAGTLQNHCWALVQAGADFRSLDRELVGLRREAGNRAGLATAFLMSGLAALEAGDTAAARVELQESARLAQDVGSSQLKLYTLVNLGLVAFLDGDHQPARVSFVDALGRARNSDKSTVPYALLGLALTTPANDPERAAMLHGAVDRLLEQAGESLERLEARLREQDRARLIALLGDERFLHAHSAGWTRPLEEIISVARQV